MKMRCSNHEGRTIDMIKVNEGKLGATYLCCACRAIREIGRGQIITYKQDRGFGFIRNRHSVDFFFHIRDIEDSNLPIDIGSEVIFQIGYNGSRLVAKNVKYHPNHQTRGGTS